MSKPRTILLIPTDPKLLEGGPCGYRPPAMYLLKCDTHGRRWAQGPIGLPLCPVCGELAEGLDPHALALAQDGLVLHPGCFAAVPYGEHGMGVVDLLDAVRDCLRGYTVVWPAGMEGEIVLLDADGQVMT